MYGYFYIETQTKANHLMVKLSGTNKVAHQVCFYKGFTELVQDIICNLPEY